MLERPLLPIGHESAVPDGALRMPAWSELAARFGAARDLRMTLHGPGAFSSGGFARFCATDPDLVNNEHDGVNLTGLAHGKHTAATLSPPEESFPEAHRETP